MPRSSARPDSSLVDGVVQLSFAVQDILTRVGARYDMSVVQMRLLGILRDRQPAMMEIAEYLQLDRSSVTGLVSRAEKRGMVERLASLSDGRGVQVRLTTLGRRLCGRAAAEVEAEVRLLTASITASESAAFTHTLVKLVS